MPPEPRKILPFPGLPGSRPAGSAPDPAGPAIPAPAGEALQSPEGSAWGEDEGGLARLYLAEDREALCRTLAGLLVNRGLPDKFTLLARDEISPEMRIVHSTDILPETWSEIRLSPLDPLLVDVDAGGSFLTGPGTPPRELAWLEMSAPVFAVLGFHSELDGRPAGHFLLHGSHAIPTSTLPFLERLAVHVEVALKRFRNLEGYRHSSRNSESALAAMNEMGALMGTLDLQALLTKILELALRLSGAEVGSILVYREGALRSRVEWGFGEAEMNSVRLQDGRTLVEAVLASGETEYVPDVYLDSRLDTGQEPLSMESIVVLPLVTTNGVLGVINVVNVSEDRGFTPDRLSTLATISSLAAIAVENVRFHEEAIESEKLKEQARIAETIQRGFFPRQIPDFPGCELAGRTAPAQFVGGDYYDFIPLGPGRLGVAVADVSGHGISAGLVMTMTRTLFRAEAVKEAPPAGLLRALNAHLAAEDLNGAFVTFLYAVLDRERSEVRFSSAGHTPLVHCRAADQAIEHLDLDGFPLGLFPESEYSERVFNVAPGDDLLFLTDGVLEAMNTRREPFGSGRLADVYRSFRHLPASDVLERLHEAVFNFTLPATPHDDVSTVMVKFLPRSA